MRDPSNFYNLDRKSELRGKILEAIDHGEETNLDLLKSLWVHRHGIESLPFDLENYQIVDSGKFMITTKADQYISSRCERKSSKSISKEGLVSSYALEKAVFEKRNFHRLFGDLFGKFLGNFYWKSIKDQDKKLLNIDKIVKAQTLHSECSQPPPRQLIDDLRRWLPVESDDSWGHS